MRDTLKGVKLLALAALTLFYAAIPQQSWASGSIMLPGTHLAAGGLQENISGLVLIGRYEAGRSYACTAVGLHSESELSVDFASVGSGGTEVQCGNVTPAVYVNSFDSSAANNRVCAIIAESGSYSLTVQSGKSGGGSRASRVSGDNRVRRIQHQRQSV